MAAARHGVPRAHPHGLLIALLMLMTVTRGDEPFRLGDAALPLRAWAVIGRHLISATHHSLHRTRFDANLGLYFRFWDRPMGTDAMPRTEDRPARPDVRPAP